MYNENAKLTFASFQRHGANVTAIRMEATRALSETFGLQDAIECAYSALMKAGSYDTIKKCLADLATAYLT